MKIKCNKMEGLNLDERYRILKLLIERNEENIKFYKIDNTRLEDLECEYNIMIVYDKNL